MEKKFYGQAEYAKGLEDVIVAESSIGYVDGQKGWLVYRGIEIQELAEKSNFEETTYLLLYGKLPTATELQDFKDKLKARREIPEQVYEVIKATPPTCHPMGALRTAVSFLGCLDPRAEDTSLDYYNEVGLNLISQMATIAAAIQRHRQGKPFVKPDNSLDHTENFLFMCTGEKPEPLATKVMDICMILHADHEMNASTFTCMATISSLTDFYSSICAGIGSLKGPLHGGANEEVIKLIQEIGTVDRVDEVIDKMISEKKKIPGFGHRVYKAYDPRATVLKKFSEEVCTLKGMRHLYEIAKKIEDKLIPIYGAKGIYPNVDFYSGTVYYALGIEPAMYTPIFAVSRISGWVARVLEYLPVNRIYRPRAIYTGPMEAKYVPIEQR